jgi:hypothetical protein
VGIVSLIDGQMGRHGHDPKKLGPSTTRHEGDSASGWPGPMVGPGLGRNLGTVARHRPDKILGQADSDPIVNITFSYK